jgi:hypothetical protein
MAPRASRIKSDQDRWASSVFCIGLNIGAVLPAKSIEVVYKGTPSMAEMVVFTSSSVRPSFFHFFFIYFNAFLRYIASELGINTTNFGSLLCSGNKPLSFLGQNTVATHLTGPAIAG